MSDIYQQIWDTDQASNGLRPVLPDAVDRPADGFVVVDTVDEAGAAEDFRVLPEMNLPDRKRVTYDLCTRLFSNYALAERDPEVETSEEREEVHDFLDAVADTAPMQVAREYVESQIGTAITLQRWYTTLLEMWFRPFSMGGDPMLTGFEHVVVGEQQESKVQGYHFWYKYLLDDGFARQVDREVTFPGLQDDRILYYGSKSSDAQRRFPESVTISYRWDAPDYDRKAVRPLIKPIGGFFVGCSVEGLLALGTVRAYVGANAPSQAVINGGKYNLKLFRSVDNKHVRTFYPEFRGAAGSVPPDSDPPARPSVVVASGVRIVAALVNPPGGDHGSETVTLVNAGATPVSLSGWRLVDKNGRSTSLSGDLAPGSALTVRLDGSGVQLANKGGSIRLLDAQGRQAHTVSFSKAQASREGETILF
jgi:hypothetical protein